MAKDLKDLFSTEKTQEFTMKKGHEERFLKKLNKEFNASEKYKPSFLKMAAAAIVLPIVLGIGLLGYFDLMEHAVIETSITDNDNKQLKAPGLSLGDLSPDLKKVETYYIANINLEISQLEISNDNRVLINTYMAKLGDLNKEYIALNNELNTIGPNDQTISALINNLQLRLQLLHRLKNKLNELKSQKNESNPTQIS